jgi:hypothetical protein
VVEGRLSSREAIDDLEHEDYLEWIGGEFDPEEFDLEETNELLRESG